MSAALTLTQMQSLVQKICGDTNGVQFTNATVLSFLNLGQIEIARRTEWLIKSVDITSLNADYTYTLPTDFLQVKRLTWDSQPIWPNNPERLKRLTIETGTPYSYYPWAGKYLKFYPQPEATSGLTISLDYICTPTDLVNSSDTSELPAIYCEDLVQYAVMRCKQMDEDMAGMDAIQQSIERRLSQSQYEKTIEDNDGFHAITDINAASNINFDSLGFGGSAWQ